MDYSKTSGIKLLSFALVIALIATAFSTLNINVRAEDDPNLGLSVYYSFDDYEDGATVSDDLTGAEASLVGGASVIAEQGRGKVLNLVGDGGLRLPEGLFADVTGEEGFTIMLDVKPSSSAAEYSRVFDAATKEFRQSNDGGNGWTDDEFALVTGPSRSGYQPYDTLLTLNGTPNKLLHDSVLTRGSWQTVIMTMKKGSYQAYINSELVFTSETTTGLSTSYENMMEALNSFFNRSFLDELTHLYLGRSYYLSDSDFVGQIDNFKFYSRYMTEYEVTGTERGGTLEKDIEAAQAIIADSDNNASGTYTNLSFDRLIIALEKAEAAFQNDASTPQELNRVHSRLISATRGLLESGVSRNSLPVDYRYDFEDIDGYAVKNLGSKAVAGDEYDATLRDGTAQSVTIIQDEERGAVMELGGGNYQRSSTMLLPSDIFADVDNGFTVSMWVNVDSDTATWARLFDFGQYDTGSGRHPYIFISAYGTTELKNASGTNVQMAGNSLPSNNWAHVALSVNKEQHTLYYNGSPVETANNPNGFIDSVQNFAYNYIGRSRYTADGDLKGLVDEVAFFTEAVDVPEFLYLLGEENTSSLHSVTIGDTTVKVDGSGTVSIPVNGRKDIPAAADISVVTSLAYEGLDDSGVTVDIQRISASTSPTFEIKVTSPNGKYTSTYYVRCVDGSGEDEQVLEFDMQDTRGEIGYYGTGMLYGVSENDVPTFELVSAIKPQVLEQKAPEGVQHPTGDALRVSDMLVDADVQQIQIAVQDFYQRWPYEYNGLDDYEAIALQVAEAVNNNRHKDKYVLVIFNEPDGIWFGGNFNGYLDAYKRIYQAIKSEYPDLQIAGMNESYYSKSHWEQFIPFAIENDIMPDVFTWHELGSDFYTSWDDHYNHFAKTLEVNGVGHLIDEIPIVVNEYGRNSGDMGQNARLIHYISRFEYSNVFGCMAYWNKANSLNEIAADANIPNGAWWVFKWYADMNGEKVAMYPYNVDTIGLYGLASINEDTRTAYTIFGGKAGAQTVALNNIAETSAFQGADALHVKLYRAKYTGFLGGLDTPTVAFDGNLALVDGELLITVDDADEKDAFYAIVTPANGEPVEQSSYTSTWSATYQAENATYTGGSSSSNGYASGGRYVTLNAGSGTISFNVDVPVDGKYAVEVYYSNFSPSTYVESINGYQNRGQGVLAPINLNVDSQESIDFYFESTIQTQYFKNKTLYLDLTAGTHTLTFKNNSNKTVTMDKLDLVYNTLIGKEPVFDYFFEAYENDTDGDTTLFNVVVKEDGYYDLYLSSEDAGEAVIEKKVVLYGEDATIDSVVTTTWDPIATVPLTGDTVSAGTMYLATGINQLQVTTGAGLESLRVVSNHSLAETGIRIEAEDAILAGTAKADTRTDSIVVTDIGTDTSNSLTLKVDAEQDGVYSMVVHYINNEPAPEVNGYLHPYNIDLVERYAQITVNGGTPQTVYFINTLSWSAVHTKVIPVTLKKGENTITLWNDNSYQFGGSTQYTPDFDKFELFYRYVNEQVNVPVESINLNAGSLNMLSIGKTLELNPTITPANATDKTVIYTSNNPNVASVDEDGVVTAHKTGTALITATASSGKVSKTTVRVTY